MKYLPFWPDIQFYSKSGKLIIIEIDEICHRGYKLDKERNSKMHKRNRGMCIIRFNVDNYKKGISKVRGIWDRHIFAVDKFQQKYYSTTTNFTELKRRMLLLKKIIDLAYNDELSNKTVKLFYGN